MPFDDDVVFEGEGDAVKHGEDFALASALVGARCLLQSFVCKYFQISIDHFVVLINRFQIGFGDINRCGLLAF